MSAAVALIMGQSSVLIAVVAASASAFVVSVSAFAVAVAVVYAASKAIVSAAGPLIVLLLLLLFGWSASSTIRGFVATPLLAAAPVALPELQTFCVAGAVALLRLSVLQRTHHLYTEVPLLWTTIDCQEGPIHMNACGGLEFIAIPFAIIF